ncbi:MAG: UDP-N-acetylglucosamine 1-carboxyvinyltransferase, partial [Candidatus Gracilibacteria bacterium]
MKKFIIKGGKQLKGEVIISGSKNAALPIICASLLTKAKVKLENVPDIADVRSIIKIIEDLNVQTSFKSGILEIDASNLKNKKIPENFVKKMRASILILGALLPRLKEVKMAFPGGCVLGKRSVHAHTHALKELGCKIIDDKRGLHLRAENLKGKKITLPELSVTATENAVMAAVLAPGTTEIHLAATEPHVQDMCNFLKKMGAKISGIGTNIIIITGVKSLHGTTYKITGDYLEACTFAIAAAATNGDVVLKGINPDDLSSFWQKMEEMGVKLSFSKDSVHIYP